MAAERIAHVLLQHVGERGRKKPVEKKKYIQEERVETQFLCLQNNNRFLHRLINLCESCGQLHAFQRKTVVH